MWNQELNKEEQTKIYWCKHCNIPIIRPRDKNYICPLCGERIKLLSNDLRPVFPPEIALIELLTNNVNKFVGRSVWKGRTTYFIDGQPIHVSNEDIANADIENLRKELINRKYDYKYFNEITTKYIEANKEHIEFITDEAINYIKNEARWFDPNDIMVSFSGGKDSTVTEDLVNRAMYGQRIKYLFGDTTLEHKLTIKYIGRLKRKKEIDLFVAKNNDNNFYKIAEKIGPPSRMSRWCCYMFKTGAVNRAMQTIFGNKHILTFYGIRKNESLTRSKYNRTEDNAKNKKIINQKVCSPIFYWNEFEIWLYILSNKVDFNEAYKLGYSRVGCWCCPNASESSELLAKIYLKQKYNKWQRFLVDFAKKIGKDNAEEYIRRGGWKSRQGGQGLEEAKSVKLINQNCTVQENGKIYELLKPINDQFFNLFIPFGKLINGEAQINERLILDSKTLMPIISIQPLSNFKVKIVTMNTKAHLSLHREISHQIIKHNACKQCLKCESICHFNAIHISKSGYEIDEKKCHHCRMCTSSKYIPGGCLMCRYLRTRSK